VAVQAGAGLQQTGMQGARAGVVCSRLHLLL
jgi:hypothetical protein